MSFIYNKKSCLKNRVKKKKVAIEMFQLVKEPATKPDNPNWITGTYMVKDRTNSVVLWSLNIMACTHCAHRHITHKYKCQNKKIIIKEDTWQWPLPLHVTTWTVHTFVHKHMKENGDDGTEGVLCGWHGRGSGCWSPAVHTYIKVWHGSAVPASEKAEAGWLIEPRFSRPV